MTSRTADTSIRKAAIVAGFGLLIMTIFAVFADSFVFQKLIVPEDATTTANNIMANEMQFRIGICSFLIVIICDVLVAWALYVFLRPVNKSLSLLAGWFRLVYSTIFAVALVNYLSIFQLLSGADYLAVFNIDQLHARVMLHLNTFSYGWAIGYVFFGFHLALLGYLVFKSNYIPRVLGLLLIVAGLGWLIDSFTIFLLPNYDADIGMFTGIFEALFMLWLLFKGVKVQLRDKPAR